MWGDVIGGTHAIRLSSVSYETMTGRKRRQCERDRTVGRRRRSMLNMRFSLSTFAFGFSGLTFLFPTLSTGRSSPDALGCGLMAEVVQALLQVCTTMSTASEVDTQVLNRDSVY